MLNGSDLDKDLINDRGVRKFPNLFLVGCARCGSTTLHNFLSEHPDIFMSTPKEPRYFNDTASNDFTQYVSLFENADDHLVIGESSVVYTLNSPTTKITSAKIQSYIRKPKILYIVRDPIKQIISSWRTMVRNETSVSSIDELIYGNLGDQWLARVQFNQITSILAEYFGEESVRVVFLDDLQRNSQSEMSSIFNFIGLRDYALANPKLHSNNTYYEPELQVKLAESTHVKIRDNLRSETETFLARLGKPKDFWNLDPKLYLHETYWRRN